MVDRTAWIQSMMNEPIYESSERRYTYVKDCLLAKMDYWNVPVTPQQRFSCETIIEQYRNTNTVTDAQFRNLLELFEIEQLRFAGL
jgi:hypothetical protein